MATPFPDPSTVHDLVALAVTAPSIHNTQPWRWRVEAEQALHLSADFTRQLMYADPRRRAMFVSCGAALHTAQVAAAALGWAVTVERDAEMAHTGHVARLTFWPRTPSPEDLALAESARERRTDRREVTSWPVPQGWFDRLRRVAAEHRVSVTGELSEDARFLLHGHLATASREQASNEAYLDELMAWTNSPGDEGIPTTSLPDRPAADQLAQGDAPTRFPAGGLADDSEDAGTRESRWLVLSTADDEPESWVRTGEALSALWLFCTAEGLSVVPYTQPVEVDTVRAAVRRDILEDQGFPQLLMRIGWPPISRVAPPPTPRRPVEEVLDL